MLSFILKKSGEFRKSWGRAAVRVVIAAFLLNAAVQTAHRILLQRGISDAVIRFHVLANSDSRRDQSIKYQVRDAVLQWMSSEMERNGESREDALVFLNTHCRQVEEKANEVLRNENAGYTAAASVEECYFPRRTYGDCTFPAGWYQALRIRLGEAGGRNWWCVLYPKLCFSDCLHGVMGEEEMKELKEVLTVEEYESLLEDPGGWKITFRWF